jgi:sulfite exporter TauE/SafE
MAATSASAPDGALIMLAFGVGTAPAMLLTGLGAARLAQLMQDRRTRLGAGLLIVMLGILTLFMPITALMSPGPHSHH